MASLSSSISPLLSAVVSATDEPNNVVVVFSPRLFRHDASHLQAGQIRPRSLLLRSFSPVVPFIYTLFKYPASSSSFLPSALSASAAPTESSFYNLAGQSYHCLLSFFLQPSFHNLFLSQILSHEQLVPTPTTSPSSLFRSICHRRRYWTEEILPLVTGGAGFIGTHTTVQLLKEGFRVPKLLKELAMTSVTDPDATNSSCAVESPSSHFEFITYRRQHSSQSHRRIIGSTSFYKFVSSFTSPRFHLRGRDKEETNSATTSPLLPSLRL